MGLRVPIDARVWESFVKFFSGPEALATTAANACTAIERPFCPLVTQSGRKGWQERRCCTQTKTDSHRMGADAADAWTASRDRTSGPVTGTFMFDVRTDTLCFAREAEVVSSQPGLLRHGVSG